MLSNVGSSSSSRHVVAPLLHSSQLPPLPDAVSFDVWLDLGLDAKPDLNISRGNDCHSRTGIPKPEGRIPCKTVYKKTKRNYEIGN